MTRRVLVQRWPAVPTAPKRGWQGLQGPVGVRRDDDGVVAAQLEDGAAEPGPHYRGDPFPHRTRAGGGHKRDAPVVQQAVAHGRTTTHHQAEHTRIDPVLAADIRRDPRDGDRGERGARGRLPQGRVPTHGRDGRVPRPDRHGEVEGADHPDHAQRMPLLAHVMILALAGHGQTVELARQSHREVADIDHLLDFAFALGADLAHFQGDERAERLLVGAQTLAEPAHDLAAKGRRHLAPLEEGAVGAVDDRVVLGLGDLVHGRDPRAVDGGEDVERGAGADPIATEATRVDVLDAECAENAACSRGRAARAHPAGRCQRHQIRSRLRFHFSLRTVSRYHPVTTSPQP